MFRNLTVLWAIMGLAINIAEAAPSQRGLESIPVKLAQNDTQNTAPKSAPSPDNKQETKAQKPPAPNQPEPKLVYTVTYDTISPIKNIPLQNAKLTLQIYINGNPVEMMNVVTGQNQTFSLQHSYGPLLALEVLSIANELEYSAICHGNAAPGSTNIEITCVVTKK